MQTDLHISKGSASMCVRQLEQWGAASKVWVKGDRKDYYEANDWFGAVLKSILGDAITKRFTHRGEFYDAVESELAAIDDGQDVAFLRERIDHIREFETKARKLWESPIVKSLLK